MRGSLSGVRSRVDRLALKLVPAQAVGCASCRGQEDTPKMVCFYGNERPDIPSEAYRVCRRANSLRGWPHGTTEQVFP
jgi:hypothetical protein